MVFLGWCFIGRRTGSFTIHIFMTKSWEGGFPKWVYQKVPAEPELFSSQKNPLQLQPTRFYDQIPKHPKHTACDFRRRTPVNTVLVLVGLDVCWAFPKSLKAEKGPGHGKNWTSSNLPECALQLPLSLHRIPIPGWPQRGGWPTHPNSWSNQNAHVLTTFGSSNQKKEHCRFFFPGFLGVRVFVKAFFNKEFHMAGFAMKPPKPWYREGSPTHFLQGKMGMENGDVFPLNEFFHGVGREFKRTEMTSHGIWNYGCLLRATSYRRETGSVLWSRWRHLQHFCWWMKEPNPTEKQKKDFPHWKSCFNMRTIPVHRSW